MHGKVASLTACTHALPPQIPQHSKVVGGGRRIGELWKDKQRDRGRGCGGGVRSDKKVCKSAIKDLEGEKKIV